MFQNMKFKGKSWTHNWIQGVQSLKRLILKLSYLTQWARKQIYYDQIAKCETRTDFTEVINSLHRYIKE